MKKTKQTAGKQKKENQQRRKKQSPKKIINTPSKKKEQTTEQRITKDMLIGEVMEKYPSLISVLLTDGIRCAGCGAAYSETIEQGLLGHGKNEKEITAIIGKLNAAIPKTFGNATLLVTDPALQKISGFLKKGEGIRIDATQGGCHGFSYTFDKEKTKKKDDTVISTGPVTIYISKKSIPYIKGTTIDYVDTPQGAGFCFINPNVKKSNAKNCGCGN